MANHHLDREEGEEAIQIQRLFQGHQPLVKIRLLRGGGERFEARAIAPVISRRRLDSSTGPARPGLPSGRGTLFPGPSANCVSSLVAVTIMWRQ